MTTPYTIPHTAQNISDAITQVVNADSTPQSPSQNMVTSEGVKAYVDGAVTNLTTNSFAPTTLVTESDAIGSNDNDTTIPTSAAVVDYVSTNSYNPANNVAYFTASDGARSSDGNIGGWTEVADPSNFCSINGSLIEIAGDTICTVIYSGRFDRSSSNQDFDYHFQLYTTGTHGGHVATPTNSGEIPHNFGNGYYFSHTSGFNKKGDNTVAYAGIYIDDRGSAGSVAYSDVAITVIRHL